MRVLAIVLLSVGFACAQGSPACTAEIPSGVNMLARLKTTLKSDTAKVGDTVQLEVADDVRNGNTVVIPKDTRLSARVVDAVPFRKGDVSRLSLRVTGVVCKPGDRPLDAYLSGVPVLRTIAADPSAAGRGAPNEWKTDQAAWKQVAGYEVEPIANVEIREAGDDAIGTVLLNRKNNVKLDSGVLLKLRTR